MPTHPARWFVSFSFLLYVKHLFKILWKWERNAGKSLSWCSSSCLTSPWQICSNRQTRSLQGHRGIRVGSAGHVEASCWQYPGPAGESLRGPPRAVSHSHLLRSPPPSCHEGAWQPPQPGREPPWQPARPRHFCIPTQQFPKRYLSGHCHWNTSVLFLESRTWLFCLLSKTVRIHQNRHGCWLTEKKMRDTNGERKGGTEKRRPKKRIRRRMGCGKRGPFISPPSPMYKHVWKPC